MIQAVSHSDNFLEKLLHSPLETVADYYAGCLAESSRAIEFVKEELGYDAQQASEKRIGLADRSLGKQIPHRRIKQGREIRDLLVALGLYKANGRETLRGRVTEPIVDENGNIVGLRGYKLDPHSDGAAVVVVGDDRPQASGDRLQEQPETTTNHANDTNEDTSCLTAQDSGLSSEDSGLTTEEGQITFRRDDRRYRIRGLEKNASSCTLKVSMMASRDGLVHLDSLDLVKARSRASFVKAAATELYVDEDIVKKDIGTLLLKLETLQSERIESLKRPNNTEVAMTDAQRSEAMDLLCDPNLLQRIVSDMDACGIVGEATNKLAGYLAATSRKLEKPLAVVIQSSSSAGKTSLMDAILAMMPDEDTAASVRHDWQSLFYLDRDQTSETQDAGDQRGRRDQQKPPTP